MWAFAAELQPGGQGGEAYDQEPLIRAALEPERGDGRRGQRPEQVG